MKNAYKVTKERISFWFSPGTMRHVVSATLSMCGQSERDDAEELGTFDTLEQADTFARTAAAKTDLSIFKIWNTVFFDVIRVSERVNGGGFDSVKEYGPSLEEKVNAVCD